MGSIFGASILYILSKHGKLPTDLNNLIRDLFVDFEEGKILLIILLGMTYCYIASGPILVFHTGRFFFKKLPWPYISSSVFLVSVYVLGALISSGKSIAFSVSALSLLILLVAQLAICILCLRRPTAIYDFYERLAHSRASRIFATKNRELVESYRHLREHGNSFFIVLCEIVFASSLYFLPEATNSCTYTSLVTFLVLWIIPPVAVWLVATRIEATFNRDLIPGEML